MMISMRLNQNNRHKKIYINTIILNIASSVRFQGNRKHLEDMRILISPEH